jgi:HEAT repeat protein
LKLQQAIPVHSQKVARGLIVLLLSSGALFVDSANPQTCARADQRAATDSGAGANQKKLSPEIAELLEKLKSTESKDKIGALKTLQAVPPSLVPIAVQKMLTGLLLHDKDRAVRAEAAESLGAFASDETIAAALLHAMDTDADPSTRWTAANAIPPGKKYLPEILKGMENKDPELRVRMVDKFRVAPVEDPDAVMALMDLLHDPDASVRGSVAQALAKYGAKARMTEPALMKAMLTERTHLTRVFEIRALARIGNIRLSDLRPLQLALDQERDSAFKIDCIRAIACLGPKAAPAVNQILHYMSKIRDPKFCAPCADSFALIGHNANPAIPRLAAILTDKRRDPNRDHYAAALGAIATRDDKIAIEALQAALSDPDPFTRKAAAQSLEKLHVKPNKVAVH